MPANDKEICRYCGEPVTEPECDEAEEARLKEQERVDNYDGPGDAYYADTGESSSYRAEAP